MGGEDKCKAHPRLPVIKPRRHPVIPAHLWNAQHCVNDLLHQPCDRVHADNRRKQHPVDEAVSRGLRQPGLAPGRCRRTRPAFWREILVSAGTWGGDYDCLRVAATTGGEADSAGEARLAARGRRGFLTECRSMRPARAPGMQEPRVGDNPAGTLMLKCRRRCLLGGVARQDSGQDSIVDLYPKESAHGPSTRDARG